MMELEEINRYLYACMPHSIVVDVREITEAPGWLRMITIHRDSGVSIEFLTCEQYLAGNPEGGFLKYTARFDSIETLVRELVRYIGLPMFAWKNFTSQLYEPTIVAVPDWEASQEYFKNLVRNRSPLLPDRQVFGFSDGYWRQIERYGEYRDDLFWEEEEQYRRERYGDRSEAVEDDAGSDS